MILWSPHHLACAVFAAKIDSPVEIIRFFFLRVFLREVARDRCRCTIGSACFADKDGGESPGIHPAEGHQNWGTIFSPKAVWFGQYISTSPSERARARELYIEYPQLYMAYTSLQARGDAHPSHPSTSGHLKRFFWMSNSDLTLNGG